MADALEVLRSRVERFYAAAGRSQLDRWRGAAPNGPVGHSPLSRALVSDESVEAIDSARSSGRIDAEQAAWLSAHLDRIRLVLALAQRRTRLARSLHRTLNDESGGAGAIGRASKLLETGPGTDRNELARSLEALAEPLVSDWLELLAVLRERSDAAPPEGLVDELQQFMKQTDGLADELVGRQRLGNARGSRPWAELLLALRAHELDGLTAARDRHRRVAGCFEGLGFGSQMARTLTVERGVPGIAPVVEVALLEVPGDVRVGPPDIEYGLWADQCMARALGRAVSLALVAPGLAAEQRWPLADAAGPVLGALFGQLLADPLCVRRTLGYSARDAERVQRHQAALVVLTTRARVAVALAGPGRDGHDALERLEQALERALRVPVPAALAGLFGARPEAWREADACLRGLALAVGLRERFDEDWFRNPAAGFALGAACERGAECTARALSEVASVSRPSAAAERAVELGG